ncbi:MAG: YihY family inner membrane protein [Deltaproteobacteria bacterium]|nr:YihY family inner membrane protein [Deltaproteobacteria bacterium]
MSDLPAGSPPPRSPPPPTSITQRFLRVVEQVVNREGSPSSGERRAFYPLYVARVIVAVVRQWARDRCPQQAAALAFETALSLVPLTAIALALLRATGAFAAESSLVDFLSKQVIPVSRKEIAEHLLSWAGNMTFQAAGLAGVVTTILLSFIMYRSVEHIFNDIWRVERRRSLGQKFVVFYAVVTIVPLFVGISIFHAAKYGLTTGLVGALGALGATWGGLFFANKLLPATHVTWRAAAIGALLSALCFEAAKHLFQLYVAKVAFERYAGVYGTLGLVPILLIWIYYTWLVILLGAEVAHAVQNLHYLERFERRSRGLERGPSENVNGVTAARLMCAVVASFRASARPVGRAELSRMFQVSEDVVERVMRRLKDHRLVLEVEGDVEGYLPARPPSDMTLADVLTPFRGSDVISAPPDGEIAPLEHVLREIEATIRRAGAVSLEELTRGTGSTPLSR